MVRGPGAVIVTMLWLAAAVLAEPQRTVFTSRVIVVPVDVLVTKGKLVVPGLSASDFQLEDNGVPQPFRLIAAADLPLNVVLAFDTSGSTQGQRLTHLEDAARALVGGLHAADRIALTTFSHRVIEQVPLTSEFSRVTSLFASLKPSGETAIFEAIHSALMTTQTEPGRSLVIVCTDGRDTQSWLRGTDVLDMANRSNAVVYAIASGSARRWEVLSHIADETGGHTIEIDHTSDLRRQVVGVLDEFRSRYLLTFTPSADASQGLHRLTVHVLNHPDYAINARSAYISVSGGQ